MKQFKTWLCEADEKKNQEEPAQMNQQPPQQPVQPNKMTLPEVRSRAIIVHGNQMYNGDQPYIVHLDEVAAIVKPWGEHAQFLAYLHDEGEDVNKHLPRHERIGNIRNTFGDKITREVDLITDEDGKNRRERKAKGYQKLAAAGPDMNIAIVVKVADRLANVRRGKLNDMYRKEHAQFKAAAYRPGLCDNLWQEIETILGV